MRVGTKVVVDRLALGRRGMPRFPEAHGLDLPTKVVPVDEGDTQTEHPGLSLAEQVDIERDRRISVGFYFNGVMFQSRPDDRENILGASMAAFAAMGAGASIGDYRWHGGPDDFVWISEDNATHPMDAQTMVAFGQAALAHKQALIFAARSLKNMAEIPADYAADQHWPTASV